MAQTIDLRFRDQVESHPLNTRFLDITGPCVLQGFRLVKGTVPFAVTLSKDGFSTSTAVTPSGARVMEDSDLVNLLTISPNSDPAAVRKDGIYLRYVYGTQEATADYVVVPGYTGTSVAAPNPNPLTHLLLGYIHVPPNSVDLVFTTCFESTPYGFYDLNVSGPSTFYGPVTFKDLVTFEDGSTGGGSGGGSGGSGGSGTSASLQRFPYPAIATAGQTDFALPTGAQYTPGTNSLFVFVDWVLQPPGMYLEKDNQTFAFYTALNGGEKVYAFWFTNLTLYEVAPHNHDDRYYTKDQSDLKAVKYLQGNMNGPTGVTLTHNIGNINYVVTGVVPTTRNLDVGSVSIDKNANTIVVYNTGTYRGPFDLSYILQFV